MRSEKGEDQKGQKGLPDPKMTPRWSPRYGRRFGVSGLPYLIGRFPFSISRISSSTSPGLTWGGASIAAKMAWGEPFSASSGVTKTFAPSGRSATFSSTTVPPFTTPLYAGLLKALTSFNGHSISSRPLPPTESRGSTPLLAHPSLPRLPQSKARLGRASPGDDPESMM